MKSSEEIIHMKIIRPLIAFVALIFAFSVRAQSSNSVPADLTNLVHQIQVKLNAGKATEADLSDEIKMFDVLIAKESGAKTEAAAQIAFLKAKLYLEIFHDIDRSKELLTLVSTNYPGTISGKNAGETLAQINSLEDRQKSLAQLMAEQTAQFHIGENLAGFDEKDLNGKPISTTAFKGKVVLIDFWATWCPPCLIEMPNVIATYQKYHGPDFEIIGISSDDDRDALVKFLAKHSEMGWPQYFDERGPSNKLATQYNIKLIPFNILLNRDGKIIGVDLKGKALGEAVAKALGK